jgi:hypothetical protein
LAAASCTPRRGPAAAPAPVPPVAASAGVRLTGGDESIAKALLERLSAVAREPQRFHAVSQRPLDDARQMYLMVAAGLRSGAWHEEKRVHCPERNGAFAAEGAALVTDANGRIRALTVLGGTDDHYDEQRFFFDEALHLRLLFLKYADVQGGAAEHLVYFDMNGAVLACDKLAERIGMADWDLCSDENPPPRLDADVAKVLRDESHVPRNRMRETLQKIDPRNAFEACEPR